ncbi:unnamed protein product [Prunus armeniaca]
MFMKGKAPREVNLTTIAVRIMRKEALLPAHREIFSKRSAPREVNLITLTMRTVKKGSPLLALEEPILITKPHKISPKRNLPRRSTHANQRRSQSASPKSRRSPT